MNLRSSISDHFIGFGSWFLDLQWWIMDPNHPTFVLFSSAWHRTTCTSIYDSLYQGQKPADYEFDQAPATPAGGRPRYFEALVVVLLNSQQLANNIRQLSSQPALTQKLEILRPLFQRSCKLSDSKYGWANIFAPRNLISEIFDNATRQSNNFEGGNNAKPFQPGIVAFDGHHHLDEGRPPHPHTRPSSGCN